MKKTILLFIFILSQNLFCQNILTENQKLVATCKVWGFLKYYHPKVANGEFNWDKQLFEILPKIDQAKTKDEFSLVLETWINSLGEIKEIAPIVTPKDIEYFDKNFDLSWIDKNKLFSIKLSKKLRYIEKNRMQGNQFYVAKFNAGNIFVKNEDYSSYNFIDKKEKLIGLFMYWNLVEYFFPYKYKMDKNWDITLQEMMPNFNNSENKEFFYLALEKLTVRLNDSHTMFFRYYKRGIHRLPIVSKIIDDKMIVTEILDSVVVKVDGIKTGDLITEINDKTIKELIYNQKELIGASNEASFLNKTAQTLIAGSGENIKLNLNINGINTQKIINWTDYNETIYTLNEKNKKKKFKLLDNNIGYVNMGQITVKNVPEMINNLKNTKAIVFDLRNYPKETYAEISNFLNANEKTFAIYTIPDLTYPGKFIWKEGTSTGSNNPDNYKGKVIVLLNEDSISQPEWTAMCFQTVGNTTIVGSQTGGADGNVTELNYIKECMTRFTGLGVYYPDRRETQRIGIIPDIEVKPTILGIQQGKDEVLDRAIEFIETGK